MNEHEALLWVEDQAVVDGCEGTYLGAPIRDGFVSGASTLYFDVYISALVESGAAPVEDPVYLSKRPLGEKRRIC